MEKQSERFQKKKKLKKSNETTRTRTVISSRHDNKLTNIIVFCNAVRKKKKRIKFIHVQTKSSPYYFDGMTTSNSLFDI